MPITGRIELGAGAEIKDLPPVRILAAVHKGGYETLHLTYKELFDYLMKKGMEAYWPN
jgi:effector-binding domain-containing protein